MILESYDHGDTCFVTLTYLDDPWSLVPRDLVLFLKRLRKAIGRPIRYFACGEYGDKSGRPHFHVVLYGVSQLERETVYKSWGHGFVDVGELNPRSAAYVCGYLCKKGMRRWGSGALQGRHPEFVRMSLKPGIGSSAIDSISRQLMGHGPSSALVSAGDVPSEVRIAGKRYPLGRYLRSLLRAAIGWAEAPPREVVVQLALRKSLESSEEIKKLKDRRKHSAAKAAFNQELRRSKVDL